VGPTGAAAPVPLYGSLTPFPYYFPLDFFKNDPGVVNFMMPSPPFVGKQYLMFVPNAAFLNTNPLSIPWSATSYSAFHTLPKQFILDSVVHYDIDPGILPVQNTGICSITDTYVYRVFQCGSTQPLATFTGTMSSGPTCESFPDPKPIINACTPIYVTVELAFGALVGDPYFTLYIREVL
jgi:hypothetical protein